MHGTLPPESDGRRFRSDHNPKSVVTLTHWSCGAGVPHDVELSADQD
ncbi:hypothetical protein ACIBCN_36585 [Nocardia sp. NPDC051052]